MIDDLTAGLSLPAKRRLWQFIISAQKHQPRTIFYATRDIAAARTLGAEIWFVDNGNIRYQWSLDNIPPILHSAANYTFTLKTSAAAGRFDDKLSSNPYVLNRSFTAERTVNILVTDQNCIVELMLLAGSGLSDFRSRSLDVDYFSAELLKWKSTQSKSICMKDYFKVSRTDSLKLLTVTLLQKGC